MRDVRHIVWMLFFGALAACQTNRPVTTISEAFPADGFIDVTVLAQRAAFDEPSPATAGASHLRPSKYIVYSDGTMRYGIDSDGTRGPLWLPPVARHLTDAELQQIWSLAKDLGIASPASADPLVSLNSMTAARGERSYLIDVVADGQRWNFVRRSPLREPADPAFVQFIELLGQFARADESAAAAMIAPNRYDFGPDPYASYRKSQQ